MFYRIYWNYCIYGATLGTWKYISKVAFCNWILIKLKESSMFFRPSPKLVLIILQLCRVALPLMSTDDCEYVELPSWGQHMHSSHWNNAESISDPAAKIVSLLLAKLGDFLVPGMYIVWRCHPEIHVWSGSVLIANRKYILVFDVKNYFLCF